MQCTVPADDCVYGATPSASVICIIKSGSTVSKYGGIQDFQNLAVLCCTLSKKHRFSAPGLKIS